MGDGMPTIVCKGFMGMRLDRRYATPEKRWESLKALRAGSQAGGDWNGVAVSRSTTHALSVFDEDKLDEQWFGGGNSHWNALVVDTNASTGCDDYVPTDLPPERLIEGRKLITAGLIEALEISLGLGNRSEVPPGIERHNDPYMDGATAVQTVDYVVEKGAKEYVQHTEEELLDVGNLTRNLPVDVYWVCGKMDGFEVQVSWNAQQVTVFILTPPVAWAIDLNNRLPNKAVLPYDDAKRGAARGMILVTSAPTSNAMLGTFQPECELISLRDGGITVSKKP